MVKSKLTSEELKELYLSGRTIQELVPLAGISKVAIWKRLHQLNTPMRPAMTSRPWAKTKRGSEFIGSDGRVWVRGVRSTSKRGSKRRAIVVMEGLIGGPIPKGYHVHHVDGNKTHDDPFNLELLPAREHNKISSHQRKDRTCYIENTRTSMRPI